jgi:hypothetical protein
MLNLQEAQAVTYRLRQHLNDQQFTDDIMAAFEGQVWKPMGYRNWNKWCEAELGGFKLPAPQRKSIVDRLAGRRMSNRAIAEVVGAHPSTVDADRRKSGAGIPAPDKVIGQDGKTYPVRREEYEVVDRTPHVEAEERLVGLLDDSIEIRSLLSSFEEQCLVVKGMAEAALKRGPFGDPVYVEQLNRASSILTDAMSAIFSATLERAPK